jgi:hypothetical protein
MTTTTVRRAAVAAVVVFAAVACTRHVPGPAPTIAPTTSVIADAPGSTYTPPPSAVSTPSDAEVEQWKTRVDDAIAEIGPAKDTLAAALQTGDFAAVHIGCGPVGKAGRDLSAALAVDGDYYASSQIAQTVKDLRHAADALQHAEQDCLAINPSSTQADLDRLLADVHDIVAGG